MSQKTFSLAAGSIFFIVALVHLLRLALRWHVAIANWTVPIWVSWVGFLVAAYLAYTGLSLSRRP